MYNVNVKHLRFNKAILIIKKSSQSRIGKEKSPLKFSFFSLNVLYDNKRDKLLEMFTVCHHFWISRSYDRIRTIFLSRHPHHHHSEYFLLSSFKWFSGSRDPFRQCLATVRYLLPLFFPEFNAISRNQAFIISWNRLFLFVKSEVLIPDPFNRDFTVYSNFYFRSKVFTIQKTKLDLNLEFQKVNSVTRLSIFARSHDFTWMMWMKWKTLKWCYAT